VEKARHPIIRRGEWTVGEEVSRRFETGRDERRSARIAEDFISWTLGMKKTEVMTGF
jgi:hypothetical protein